MKKHFNYKSDKQLWRILISDSDKLVLENRNQETKEVFFQCFDLQSGTSVFLDLQLAEKNWIGIETIYKDIIYFHYYPQRDLPGHKEIIAFDLASQRILWHNKDLTFLFADDDKIYAFQQGFEDRFFYTFDYLTGEQIEELGSNYNLINSLRQKAEEKKNWSNYIYPEVEKENESSYHQLINDYTNKFQLVGEIEHAIYNDVLLFSFHTKEKDQSMNNRFVALKTATGDCLKDEIINYGVKSFLTDSFFIYKSFLFLLKGKNEIEVYDLLAK